MDAQDFNSNIQHASVGDLAGGASDKGPTRSENQDAFWIPETETRTDMGALFLVADGVGGQESGAEAAQMAVKTARDAYYELRQKGVAVRDALKDALQRANLAVYDEAQRREVRRMGATFVAAVSDQGQLTIAHVGDARAYLVRQGEMRRLTRDDTWVQKQVEEGFLTEEQAARHEYRNIVTQVLGNKPEVNVHLSQGHALLQDDVVLLCSDGLYDALPGNQMLPILTGNPPQNAANQLVEDAIKAEATDNITAVVVRPKPGKPTAITPAAAMVTAHVPDMADEPTMAIAPADEPTLTPRSKPVTPPSAAVKSKSKAPKWLIILAIAAVILIAAILLLFWLRNRGLEATVESAADSELTSSTLVDTPASEGAGALRPAPTIEPVEAGSQLAPTATDLATALPTEPPPATPTLRPSPTVEATVEPHGCVNDSVIAFVWNQAQLDAGDCSNTPLKLEIGEEVRVLEETAVTAGGTCSGVQFIKVQSLIDDDLEGWVTQNAIFKLAVGASCNP